MRGTRWRKILRQSLGTLRRELKLTLTRVPVDRHWVFIVGCYNSGTELLSSMLGEHPSISALPDEGQFLTDQLPADYQLGLSRMWTMREDLYRLTENDLGPDPFRVKKEWGMRLDLTRPVFLEKSPPNSARTRWLQRHFENASFIAMVRNGFAVAEGIRRKARPLHPVDGWPLDQCARQWVRCNEILDSDSALLTRFKWLRYEDLTERPGESLSALFEFLGVHDAPGTLDPGRSWSIHERDEPIRNMNRESLDRLSESEWAIVRGIAEPTLARFGYGLERPSSASPES